jgi:hypothetical protein
MKRVSVFFVAVFALAFVVASSSTAQQTGSIDFVARVSPTGGHPEPIRGNTFYLLRKSYQEIQREGEDGEVVPKMDDFISTLKVSDELKAWMKKHASVELYGPDFVTLLKPDDVLTVPEFRKAYFEQNSGDRTVSLPKPKFKEADKEKNPQRYQQQVDEYEASLKRFITQNPDTLSTIFVPLESINPSQRWKKMLNDRAARVRRHTGELAELQYMVAKTETDLEGRGRFAGLAPGEYWLSTLETEALAGDARVRWDLSVKVTAGRAANIELNNLNGIAPKL